MPEISSLSPASGAINVDLTSNIVLTFNDDMAAGMGSIVLVPSSSSGSAVTIGATDAQVDVTTSVVTIDPTASLVSAQEEQVYTVTVASGPLWLQR